MPLSASPPRLPSAAPSFERPNLCLVISSLGGGGAERVMSELANAWVENGHGVTLITTSFDSIEDFYALDGRIRRVRLNRIVKAQRRSAWVQWRRLLALRRAIAAAQPGCIISFINQQNVVTLLAALGLDIPVFACEHSEPRREDIGRVWSMLRRLTYPLARGVVVLTEGVAAWLRAAMPRARVHVIHNPVPRALLSRPVPDVSSDPSTRHIVTMGRLSEVKQFDGLIACFAGLATEFPDWTLWIWGDGPLRPALEAQCANLEMSDRVFLPGATKDPWAELSRAGVFVLCSRHEGQPMVLAEAMALGRPCISFDCLSGPRELSGNGEKAMLVPPQDWEALSQGLRQLMSDAHLRAEFGNRALTVRRTYDLDQVLRSWQTLIDDAHGPRRAPSSTRSRTRSDRQESRANGDAR